MDAIEKKYFELDRQINDLIGARLDAWIDGRTADYMQAVKELDRLTSEMKNVIAEMDRMEAAGV